MDPAQWLAIGPDHGSFLREKRARLKANSLPFYRTTPGSLPGQIELRDRVVADLLPAIRSVLTGRPFVSPSVSH